jgi:cell division protein FtsL
MNTTGPSDTDVFKIGTDGKTRIVNRLDPKSKLHPTAGDQIYPPNLQNDNDLRIISEKDVDPQIIAYNATANSRTEIVDIYRRFNKKIKFIYIILFILIIFLIIFLSVTHININKKINKLSNNVDKKIQNLYSLINKKIDTVTKSSTGNII